MRELVLGVEVEDRVTGYKGIAIATTHYMQGCDRILVQAKAEKSDGEIKIPEPQTFDEPDLVVIGRGILPKPEPREEKNNGGPRPIAERRHDRITR